MEAEIREIRDHIGQYPPFESLGEELLDEIAASVEIAYHKAGSTVIEFGEPIHALPYIRSGAVEVYRRNGELYNRLGEGDIFGQLGLLLNRRVRFPVKAIEDTLLYLIPETVFDRLCAEEESFADFVGLSGSRLKSTVEQSARDNDMMVTDQDLRERILAEGLAVDTPLAEITHGRLDTIQSDESVYEAMLTMLRNNIQRLPVLQRRRSTHSIESSELA